VDKEIIPYATDLEHKDEFPEAIVEGMKEMGLFGLMIPEEYGGLGESLLTYALVVEQIARGWMSVSGVINTHFIVAYMLMQHGTQEQKERPAAAHGRGELRGGFSMSEPACGSDVSAIKSKACATATSTCSTARRCGSPTARAPASSPRWSRPTRAPTRSTRT
jgi:alkylation response protein AidB-like acyl-CoA dehydrogenase